MDGISSAPNLALAEALRLHSLGFPLALINPDTKRPVGTAWQDRIWSTEELTRRITNNPALGIGLILGPQSGLVDIECDSAEALEHLKARFGGQIPDTPWFQSKRGPHYLFAWHPTLAIIDKAAWKLDEVEYRIGSNPAQSVAPPSGGRKWIIPLSAEQLPTQLPDEFVNQLVADYAKSKAPKRQAKSLDPKKPGDDYCQRGPSWPEILEPHGWILLGIDADGVEHWQRPGGDRLSATANFCTSESGRNLFYVFSTAAEPFEGGHCYSKFSAFAILNHSGDFKAAAADLASQGYGEQEKEKQPSCSSNLIALSKPCELFHYDNEPYATCPVGNHRETYPVNSQQFKRWLVARYDEHTQGGAPTSKALAEALLTIASRAIHHGEERTVHVRIANVDDKTIYLDLANKEWQVVKITADDWQVIDCPDEIKFKRPNGMKPLPIPTKGGSIDDLRRLLNVSDDDFRLVVAWLVASLRGTGPFLILLIRSSHGSGKSTFAIMLRGLIDPNAAALRLSPRKEESALLGAINGHVAAYDNVSKIADWLADVLCCISTGAGYSTRRLYTDGDEFILSTRKPVLVAGISDLTNRGDFLDRCLIVEALPITDRKCEADLYRQYDEAKPGILGALLDAVSLGLKTYKPLVNAPRMADAASWCAACLPAFGWSNFLDLYVDNRTEGDAIALDSPVVNALQDVLPFDGASSDLLAKLRAWQAEHGGMVDNSWPTNARELSELLRRLEPNLMAAGITIGRRKSNGQKLLTIKKAA